jgi:hypothetical protein
MTWPPPAGVSVPNRRRPALVSASNTRTLVTSATCAHLMLTIPIAPTSTDSRPFDKPLIWPVRRSPLVISTMSSGLFWASAGNAQRSDTSSMAADTASCRGR